MFAFFTFVLIMSFTPGPNTIMAMVAGQNRGIRHSIPLNLGMATGMGLIGFVGAFFASWLVHATQFVFVMKIVGCGYLLYLAYHVLVSRPNSEDGASGGFMAGFLLQLTNVKVYLYFATGLSTFMFGGWLSLIPVKWVLMVLIGSFGTFAWTVGGKMMDAFYRMHYRGMNLVISLLLVFSAIDLWR